MGQALTELSGDPGLLHEPEGQGGEGVALRGLRQLEGVKVPVVCRPQHCFHLRDGGVGDAGQVHHLTAAAFIL